MNHNVLTLKELNQYKGIWHSIKIEHIANIFKMGKLESHTSHRWWPDGHVYRDNHDKYNDSFYMKGWSMTRDKDYAFSWSCVTFLLDWELIRRDFKIRPFSWNYLINSAKGNFDKEREEFIISNIVRKTMKEIEQEYNVLKNEALESDEINSFRQFQETHGYDHIDYWQKKGNKVICLDRYLKGIFVSLETYNIYKGKHFSPVLSHPLFKGFVSSSEARERHRKSMKKIYC